MIYLVIGITMAFLLTATLIYSVCHCVSKNTHQPLANKTSETLDNIGEISSHRSTSRQTFNRHSYLQQSPMTEETISLDEYESFHRSRSIPKLIYTQEFSDGLMVLPNENGIEIASENGGIDPSLAPLAAFDHGDDSCVVPQHFVLRRGSHHHRRPHHLDHVNCR